MPTREELAGALRKADAAGNVEDARRIAGAIRAFDAKAKPAAQTVNPMVAQGQAAQREYEAAGSPELPADNTVRMPAARDPLAPRAGEEWRKIDRSAQPAPQSPFRSKEHAERIMAATAETNKAKRENEEYRAGRGPRINAISDFLIGGLNAGDQALYSAADAGLNAIDPERRGAKAVRESLLPFAGLRENNDIVRAIPEMAAGIAENPASGAATVVEGMEPTHMIARGGNNLRDAGRAALQGDWKEAQAQYSEATPDLLFGTLGVTPFESMAVSAAKRGVAAPGEALRAQMGRAAEGFRQFDAPAVVEPPPAQPTPAPAPAVTVAPAATPKPQFFDPAGNPVEAEVVARSEKGGVIVRTKDGREVLVGDEIAERSARDPEYVIEFLDGQKSVSAMSDAELANARTRAEEVIKARQQAGQPVQSYLRDRNAAVYEQKRRAGGSAPVVQPTAPQAPPRPTQPGPSGTGQQPNAGNAAPAAGAAPAAAAQPILNATPAAAQSPIALAKSDAKIIGRLLQAGGVPRNDVNNLLTGLVQAYQGSNSSRLPLAFFAEEYLPTVLPKQTADDVIQKLRGFGRERYSANGPKDTSRSTMRNTVDTLRSTQQDNLSGVMDANLYKGKLIGQEDKLNAQLEQNARTAYTTALENANNRLLNGKATQAERDALGEIQALLHNGAFLKEVPAHLRIKAMRDGINLEDYVQKDPIAAAHWLQSELRQAVTAAEGVGGMATSESRLYGEMRTTLLEQLEKVVPGYRGARKAHGDIYGAKEAIEFGGNFFKSARSEVETARLARQFKAMSVRQKTAATMSIRDALKNEFRNKAEDTAAKVTRLQQAGVLDALETVLGADGKRVADAIRNTVKENERIRAVDMMSGANNADNLAQMEAAQEAVRSPVNKAIGSLGDNRSWAATLTGDALLAVNGLPPVLTGGKIASSAVGKLGKPSARKLASATKTLYDLPTPGANALASPPRAPRASGPRSPKPSPEQAQATLDDLLRQYDALDHRANPEAGQKLLRQIDRLKKQLGGPTPNALATPPRPPVKNGFGSSSLDMSEPARMQRAREQGERLKSVIADDFRFYDEFDVIKANKQLGPRELQEIYRTAFGSQTGVTSRRELLDMMQSDRVLAARRIKSGMAPLEQEFRGYVRSFDQPDGSTFNVSFEKSKSGAIDVSFWNAAGDVDSVGGSSLAEATQTFRRVWDEVVSDIKDNGHSIYEFIGNTPQKQRIYEAAADRLPPPDGYAWAKPNGVITLQRVAPSQSGSSKLLAGMGGRVGSQVAPPAVAATVASVGPEGEAPEDKWARMAAAAALTVGVRNLPALRKFASEARGTNQATFGGVNAKTADLKLKGIAEDMEKAGAGRDQIWKETGWFKGNDGNWKFEIPDNDLQVRPDAAMRGKGVLDDFVSDADAGGAYPELAKIPTKRGEGYYQPPEQFADEEVSFSGRGQKARSVIAHERQHAIQDMEGFATGESNNPTKFAFDAPYQAKWDAIVKEKREIMNAVDIGDLRKRQSKGERISPNEAPYLERFNELEAQQQPMMRDLLLSPEDTYRRSAGEVEARNVQKRLDMTPEERRRTPPWVTQDTPDDKQVISIQRGGGRKSAPPAQAGFSFGGGGKGPPNALKTGPVKKPGPQMSRAAEEATRELRAARSAYSRAANKWVMKDDRELRVKPLEDRVVAAENRLAEVLKNDARIKVAGARIKGTVEKTLNSQTRSTLAGIGIGAAGGTGLLMGYNALSGEKRPDNPMSPKDPRWFWSTVQNDKQTMVNVQKALRDWDEWPQEETRHPNGAVTYKDVEMTGRYGKTTKDALRSWRYARGLDPDAPMSKQDLARLLSGPKGYQSDDGAWRYGDGEEARAQ